MNLGSNFTRTIEIEESKMVFKDGTLSKVQGIMHIRYHETDEITYSKKNQTITISFHSMALDRQVFVKKLEIPKFFDYLNHWHDAEDYSKIIIRRGEVWRNP